MTIRIARGFGCFHFELLRVVTNSHDSASLRRRAVKRHVARWKRDQLGRYAELSTYDDVAGEFRLDEEHRARDVPQAYNNPE
jgi:hypothetical protein